MNDCAFFTFQYLVHDPAKLPQMNKYGRSVAPGTETLIPFTTEKVTTDKLLKVLRPTQLKLDSLPLIL